MTDSFGARSTLEIDGKEHDIFRLDAVSDGHVDRLPYSLKILLENLLRFEDGRDVTRDDILALANWDPKADPSTEISFTPARVILQDFTGVPAVVDLAAMRDAVVKLGGSADSINPLSPAELVIDHSVQVDRYGTADALDLNNKIEFNRNKERYSFLRWGQTAFENFRVVPPNTGIVHQVNLEFLGRVVFDNANDGQTPAVSGHGGWHRFTHHHDQRPWRSGLGRRRHRGGGRDARPANHDADPPCRGLQTDRQTRGRYDRDGLGPYRHRDAPRTRCGGQVRRVLWRRLGRSAARRSGDARQHVARIWQHVCDISDR